MTEIKPKEGETIGDYVKRYLREMHKDTPITEPIITHLTYKINNIETEQDFNEFVTFTKCELNSYKDKSPCEIKLEDRTIHFEMEMTPIDPEFIRYAWNQAGIIETKPSYECTGVRKDHKYRKKTYAPKLKRLMR